MGIETGTAILIGSALTAGTTGYFQNENRLEAQRTRRNQEALEAQRRKELSDEAAAREAAAAKAATSGQRVGLRESFTSALGFGSGNTSVGVGTGTLFGN